MEGKSVKKKKNKINDTSPCAHALLDLFSHLHRRVPIDVAGQRDRARHHQAGEQDGLPERRGPKQFNQVHRESSRRRARW